MKKIIKRILFKLIYLLVYQLSSMSLMSGVVIVSSG